jgi:hypothetical protein
MKLTILSFKKVLFAIGIMLVMIPQSLMAQSEKPKNLLLYDNQPYHFGFILGYNQMSYAINFNEGYQLAAHPSSEYPNVDSYASDNATYYVRSITPVPESGFVVGVVGNLRLGKYFDLRLIPSLSFGSRTLEYQFYRELNNGATDNNPYFTKRKSIFSTFVEFPLQVKYKSKRLNNIAAYVIAGGNFKIDLASQKKSQVDITSDQGELKTVTDNIRVKRTDLAAEVGAGFDFYTGYFKFGIEAKMSFGLFNILDSQNLIYDSSIKSIQNRTFQISLTFE